MAGHKYGRIGEPITMNELEAGVIGIAFVVTWAAIGFGFVLDLKNNGSISELRVQFQTLVNMLGNKFARILHSPHTPELDILLEKVYEGKTFLTKEEYDLLLKILNDIENNVGAERAKEERTIAALLETMLKQDVKYEAYRNERHYSEK